MKTPNIKEFVKYLDQTLDLFEEHIPNTDFENPDSNINKLFNTLFSMYQDISEHKDIMPKIKSPTLIISAPNIDDKQDIDIKFNNLVAKHISNKKKNTRNDTKIASDSNKKAEILYKRGLKNLNTTSIQPFIKKNNLNSDKLCREKNDKLYDNMREILGFEHQSTLTIPMDSDSIFSDIPAKKYDNAKKVSRPKIPSDIPAKKIQSKEISYRTDSGSVLNLCDTVTVCGDKTEEIDKKILQLKRILDK